MTNRQTQGILSESSTLRALPRAASLPGAGALCLALMLGCAAEPSRTEMAERTVASAQELRTECANLQEQVDKTVTALDAVVKATDKKSVLPWRKRTAEGDLHPAYEGFVAEYASLQRQHEKTTAQSDDFRAEAKSYVERWKKDASQLENADIKKQSERRYTETEQKVASMQEEIARIRSDFLAFKKNLGDIETALGIDLNQQGVLALEKEIANAKKSSVPIKRDIEKLMAAIDALSKAMSSAREQPKT